MVLKMKDQIKTIIENMKSYAKKECCVFSKTFEYPENETSVYFNDHNFILHFFVNWSNGTVKTFDSETEERETMTFKDFIMFQNAFLTTT